MQYTRLSPQRNNSTQKTRHEGGWALPGVACQMSKYSTPAPPRNPRIIRIAIRAYARGWLPLGVVAWLCRKGGQR